MGLWRVVLWIFSVSLQKAESPQAGIGMYIVGSTLVPPLHQL